MGTASPATEAGEESNLYPGPPARRQETSPRARDVLFGPGSLLWSLSSLGQSPLRPRGPAAASLRAAPRPLSRAPPTGSHPHAHRTPPPVPGGPASRKQDWRRTSPRARPSEGELAAPVDPSRRRGASARNPPAAPLPGGSQTRSSLCVGRLILTKTTEGRCPRSTVLPSNRTVPPMDMTKSRGTECHRAPSDHAEPAPPVHAALRPPGSLGAGGPELAPPPILKETHTLPTHVLHVNSVRW